MKESSIKVGVITDQTGPLSFMGVADTGIGIPGDLAPQIFDLFFRVDYSETTVHKGMGLGLYLVKKYAELLRGSVNVESEVGKGSVFTLTLPRVME